MIAIPRRLIDAYVARYPHLGAMAKNIPVIPQAARDFARNACELAAPSGVSAVDVWRLARACSGQAALDLAEHDSNGEA